MEVDRVSASDLCNPTTSIPVVLPTIVPRARRVATVEPRLWHFDLRRAVKRAIISVS